MKRHKFIMFLSRIFSIKETKDFHFDPHTNTFTIHGIRYSSEFFECFGFGRVGMGFEILERTDDDGIITVTVRATSKHVDVFHHDREFNN